MKSDGEWFTVDIDFDPQETIDDIQLTHDFLPHSLCISEDKKLGRDVREQQAGMHHNVEDFVHKCLDSIDCELKDSMTQEHVDYLINQWKLSKINNINYCYQCWTCDDGDDSTWPKLTDLPTPMQEWFIHRRPEFRGKVPATGEFPHVEGCLQSFHPKQMEHDCQSNFD